MTSVEDRVETTAIGQTFFAEQTRTTYAFDEAWLKMFFVANARREKRLAIPTVCARTDERFVVSEKVAGGRKK